MVAASSGERNSMRTTSLATSRLETTVKPWRKTLDLKANSDPFPSHAAGKHPGAVTPGPTDGYPTTEPAASVRLPSTKTSVAAPMSVWPRNAQFLDLLSK